MQLNPACYEGATDEDDYVLGEKEKEKTVMEDEEMAEPMGNMVNLSPSPLPSPPPSLQLSQTRNTFNVSIHVTLWLALFIFGAVIA